MNGEKRSAYLVVLSILMGVSVLKVPELFDLARDLRGLFQSLSGARLWYVSAGSFVFASGYIIFFILAVLASIVILRSSTGSSVGKTGAVDRAGELIGMSVICLGVAYLFAVGTIIHGVIG